MMTVKLLHRILQSIKARIDLDHVQTLAGRHRHVLNYQPVDRFPLVLYLSLEGQDGALYPVREALDHPAKTVVNQLKRSE
jgi:hypothetical protein